MSLFFFNDTATTEIYTLSLHDALPISPPLASQALQTAPSLPQNGGRGSPGNDGPETTRDSFLFLTCDRRGEKKDRKSTRLNSSHSQISYAVFCLKKKIIIIKDINYRYI